jgi:hypothetical protein
MGGARKCKALHFIVGHLSASEPKSSSDAACYYTTPVPYCPWQLNKKTLVLLCPHPPPRTACELSMNLRVWRDKSKLRACSKSSRGKQDIFIIIGATLLLQRFVRNNCSCRQDTTLVGGLCASYHPAGVFIFFTLGVIQPWGYRCTTLCECRAGSILRVSANYNRKWKWRSHGPGSQSPKGSGTMGHLICRISISTKTQWQAKASNSWEALGASDDGNWPASKYKLPKTVGLLWPARLGQARHK